MSYQILNCENERDNQAVPEIVHQASDGVTEPLTPRLAVNQVTTYHWSLERDIAEYRRAGYSGIGVWRRKLEMADERTAIERLRRSDLEVTSLSWAGGFSGATGFTFREAICDTREAIRTASRMRAQSLLIASGARGGHIRSHARRLLIHALDELGDEAGEMGVTLALAPLSATDSSWSFLESLDESLDIISACRSRAVSICFNCYHLWREHALLERIPRIARHVSLVQLSDWKQPRADYDRHRLGDGEIPLRAILQAFAAANYHGAFEIDIWSESLWNSDYVPLLRHSLDQFHSLRAPGYSELTLSH